MMGSGTAGVTLFFVLSGYLISSLLMEEKHRHGRIDVFRFWTRRAIRLLPALLAFLAVTSVLLLALGASAKYVGSGDLWSMSYAMNWAIITGHYHGPMTMAWSLAVEEQFYLTWPFLLPLVLRSRRPITALLALAVLSASARWLLFANGSWSWWRAYAGTDTNAYALLLGAAVAVLASREALRIPSGFAHAAVALFAASFLVEYLLPARAALLWAFSPAFACAGALLVAAAASGTPTWLSARPLVYFGAVSYGWYLWHSPLTGTVERQGGGPLLGVLVAAIGFACAVTSRRYVEVPFSTWARRRLKVNHRAMQPVVSGMTGSASPGTA